MFEKVRKRFLVYIIVPIYRYPYKQVPSTEVAWAKQTKSILFGLSGITYLQDNLHKYSVYLRSLCSVHDPKTRSALGGVAFAFVECCQKSSDKIIMNTYQMCNFLLLYLTRLFTSDEMVEKA